MAVRSRLQMYMAWPLELVCRLSDLRPMALSVLQCPICKTRFIIENKIEFLHRFLN